MGNTINMISFSKGEWYDYHIEIHPETGMKIYYVNDHPFIERTFRANFEDIQQKREDKLNQILNDTPE